MRIHPLLLTCLLLSSPLARSATVNIVVNAGQLYDQTGSPLAAGSLVLLVADTNNDSFGPLQPGSLAVGDYLNNDDQILYRGFVSIEDGLSITVFGNSSIAINEGLFSNLQTGDALALIWFPTLTASSLSLLGGESYGLFTTSSPQNGSSAWEVPNAAGTPDLNFFTQSTGGAYAETEAYAALTVAAVPEPATCAAVAGLLALGFTIWRKRTRA